MRIVATALALGLAAALQLLSVCASVVEAGDVDYAAATDAAALVLDAAYRHA